MRIGVVGGGLAGLSAARRALELGADVEVLESAGTVGGLASSIRAGGLTFDLGPHTLYPGDPAVVQDVETLLGTTLRRVSPTRGIWRSGRLYRFPFHLGNFVHVSGVRAAARPVLSYFAARALGTLRPSLTATDLEEWAVRRFGRPLYEFYVLHHVSKNVGVPPSELPALWGRQRIAIPDVGTALRQLSGRAVPSRTSYYPQGGIGRIVAALAVAVRHRGGSVRTGTTMVSWGRTGDEVELRVQTDGRCVVRTLDTVINTGPVDTFLRCADEGTVPSSVHRAAGRLRYRATVFVYLSTDDAAAGLPCDLCYFPQGEVFTRVYSPTGYTGAGAPGSSAGFCLEIHCDPGDGLWNLPDADLGRLTVRDAAALPFFGAAARLRVERVLRIRRHYPLSAPVSPDLTTVDDYMDGASPSVVSAGRLGSHRYVNMDSAMRMGTLAAEVAYGLRAPLDIRRVADDPVFVEDGRRRS